MHSAGFWVGWSNFSSWLPPPIIFGLGCSQTVVWSGVADASSAAWPLRTAYEARLVLPVVGRTGSSPRAS